MQEKPNENTVGQCSLELSGSTQKVLEEWNRAPAGSPKRGASRSPPGRRGPVPRSDDGGRRNLASEWADGGGAVDGPEVPDIASVVAQAMAKMSSELSAMGDRLQRSMVTAQKSNDTRLNKHDLELAELRHRLQTLEEAKISSDTRQTRVEERVAADAEAFRERATLVDLHAWDRPLDPTLLRVTAREDVPKESIEIKMRELCERASLTDRDWVVEGDELAKEFSLRFVVSESIPAGTAARRADKVLSVLRTKPGVWEEVHAAVGNDRVRLFVGKDENKRGAAVRIALKRTRLVLEKHLPRQKIFGDRERGSLSADWTPIARVVPCPAGDHKVQWNQVGLEKFHLDRQVLDAEVATSLRRVPDAAAQWV